MVVHACDSSTGKVEAGESEVEGHPQLHSKFPASLSTRDTVPKNQQKQLDVAGITLIPVLEKHRQDDLFQASLVYVVSSRYRAVHSDILSQPPFHTKGTNQGEK